MNDSLDLRNRILKMRESNNLVVTKKNSLNNDSKSKFEINTKDDYPKKPNFDKTTISNKNIETVSQSPKKNFDNKNIKSTYNDNEAQFLMLANKFNEAVEVILELSQKVEKLERNASLNSKNQNTTNNLSSFFNFRTFIYLLIIPILVLSLLTLPIDLSLIKTILKDVISKI